MFGNYRKEGDFEKQFKKFQALAKLAKQNDNIAKSVLENMNSSILTNKTTEATENIKYIDDPIVAKSIIQINQELKDKLRKVFTETQTNAILNTMPDDLKIKLHSQFSKIIKSFKNNFEEYLNLPPEDILEFLEVEIINTNAIKDVNSNAKTAIEQQKKQIKDERKQKEIIENEKRNKESFKQELANTLDNLNKNQHAQQLQALTHEFENEINQNSNNINVPVSNSTWKYLYKIVVNNNFDLNAKTVII